MQAVLGGELDEDDAELPVSVSVAFERLRKIRSFYFFLTGMAALGFALFSIPLFLNLYLDDQFGLVGVAAGRVRSRRSRSPASSRWPSPRRASDALFRRSPPAALVFVGSMIGAFGVFIVDRPVHAERVAPRHLLRRRHGALAGRVHQHRRGR